MEPVLENAERDFIALKRKIIDLDAVARHVNKRRRERGLPPLVGDDFLAEQKAKLVKLAAWLAEAGRVIDSEQA